MTVCYGDPRDFIKKDHISEVYENFKKQNVLYNKKYSELEQEIEKKDNEIKLLRKLLIGKID